MPPRCSPPGCHRSSDSTLTLHRGTSGVTQCHARERRAVRCPGHATPALSVPCVPPAGWSEPDVQQLHGSAGSSLSGQNLANREPRRDRWTSSTSWACQGDLRDPRREAPLGPLCHLGATSCSGLGGSGSRAGPEMQLLTKPAGPTVGCSEDAHQKKKALPHFSHGITSCAAAAGSRISTSLQQTARKKS